MIDVEYYKKYKINEIQAIQLELMKRASFNSFDGEAVVEDLIKNRNLWEACIMIRDLGAKVMYHIPLNVEYINNDLISLRDLAEDFWNVDTLYIIINPNKGKEIKLLAKGWDASKITMLSKEKTDERLGSWPSRKKVLMIWWD